MRLFEKIRWNKFQQKLCEYDAPRPCLSVVDGTGVKPRCLHNLSTVLPALVAVRKFCARFTETSSRNFRRTVGSAPFLA